MPFELCQGCFKLSQVERRLERCLDDVESQLELEVGVSIAVVWQGPRVYPFFNAPHLQQTSLRRADRE